MNRILNVIITGLLTGITCTIGMKIGQEMKDKETQNNVFDILDKIEVNKTKDAKIIKIKS